MLGFIIMAHIDREMGLAHLTLFMASFLGSLNLRKIRIKHTSQGSFKRTWSFFKDKPPAKRYVVPQAADLLLLLTRREATEPRDGVPPLGHATQMQSSLTPLRTRFPV